MQSAFRMESEKDDKGTAESLNLRLSDSEGSDSGVGTSAAAEVDSVKSPMLATSDNEDVIDSMVTAAEEVKGRLTMRVMTGDGTRVLVKTPGTLRQASIYVQGVPSPLGPGLVSLLFGCSSPFFAITIAPTTR